MSTPAGRLYARMVRGFPRSWFVQKIESSTGVGIPDVIVCADGFVFWVELKAAGDSLSKEQWAWMARWQDCGGSVIIYTESGWLLPSAELIGKTLK